MKSFVIKEQKKDYEVLALNYNFEGFLYKLRNKYLGVEAILIASPDIIGGLISSSFNKKYKKILELYLSIVDPDDETGETNLMIALDEIARLRSIIICKYQNILKKKAADKLLNKLKLLENEVRSKLIDFKLIKEQELVNTNVEESVKSR